MFFPCLFLYHSSAFCPVETVLILLLLLVFLKWPIWWRLHSFTKQLIFTLNYFAVNFLLHRTLPCCNSNILFLILFAVDRENWLFSLLSVLMCKVGVPSFLSLSWQEIIIIILIIILSVSGGSCVVTFLQLLLSGSRPVLRVSCSCPFETLRSSIRWKDYVPVT